MPDTTPQTASRTRPSTSRNRNGQPGRSRDPEATRSKILAAAEALFIEHGFSRVPVSAIAREAGVAKSLIHHYFKNKEELWLEIKRLRFEAYIKPLISSLRQDQDEVEIRLLANSMYDLFNFLDRNRDLVRLMSWMDLEYDADIIYDYHDLFNLGIAAFKKRQAAGSIRPDIDPKLALVAILNMIIHWFQARPQWLNAGPKLPDQPASDAKYLETLLTIFFEGILPRASGNPDISHLTAVPEKTGETRAPGKQS
jgi:TetR/AcrR family transcriptional regulator